MIERKEKTYLLFWDTNLCIWVSASLTTQLAVRQI